ncbi:hypothetical protein E2C01_026712 [Portunus trituberculatus]|uniref:Uncharacterized protein n=1 Tax=Portunus trituberculatus TaxID=210409 RepID=A0A5B7ELQ9_PORTR|nr:hypothetical protein [Portunus trituberculatus]
MWLLGKTSLGFSLHWSITGSGRGSHSAVPRKFQVKETPCTQLECHDSRHEVNYRITSVLLLYEPYRLSYLSWIYNKHSYWQTTITGNVLKALQQQTLAFTLTSVLVIR